MLVRHCEFCSQHRSEPLLFMLINDSVKDGSFDLGGGGGGRMVSMYILFFGHSSTKIFFCFHVPLHEIKLSVSKQDALV